ncbi:hypothetical protein FIBSPDRAFT_860165 [Athelia psychrophila]|uniref:Uncharacterized protein n=1 Tax=Athelia psychrophila TaxID=1759441 RepID=A0A166KKP5_9AGAM|nr:hypothetical protein FIBSPDRAFT_860165 [Fibularhizoctonia sp. CBS 109695]
MPTDTRSRDDSFSYSLPPPRSSPALSCGTAESSLCLAPPAPYPSRSSTSRCSAS